MAEIGHNSGFADKELLAFVERIERLSEEIGGLTDDRKEVFAEAKAHGFDTAIMRKVITRRKLDAGTRQEIDALMDLYETALNQAESKALAKSVAEGA